MLAFPAQMGWREMQGGGLEERVNEVISSSPDGAS